MDLPAWMAREGLNLTAAAERLGIPVATLHNYLGGYRRPSLRRASAMSAATGGAVSVAALLPEAAAAFGITPRGVAARKKRTAKKPRFRRST